VATAVVAIVARAATVEVATTRAAMVAATDPFGREQEAVECRRCTGGMRLPLRAACMLLGCRSLAFAQHVQQGPTAGPWCCVCAHVIN
jgi:hypothetical protein